MADSMPQACGSSTKSNAEPVGTESKKQPTEFLALNDLCCLEIFKYLPLNDVCALSQTCRRLYALGTDHFTLNYKSKILVYIDFWDSPTDDLLNGAFNRLFTGSVHDSIKNFLDSSLHTFPYRNDDYAKYARCFANRIQNVTLLKHFSTIEAMEKLSAIYQSGNDGTGANVLPMIKIIRFLDWQVAVGRAHCTPIAGILKNVESLTIENTSIDVDLNDCLFAFMPLLKQFTVLTFPNLLQKNNISSNIAWLQQLCPTLEYFAWHVAQNQQNTFGHFPATEIERFLTVNPGIKYVSLRLDSKEQLKVLMASKIPVNELFFAMDKYYNDTEIAEIIDDLKFICENRKSMKKVEPTRLHLRISGHQFEKNPGRLELLAPYIIGLYIESLVLKCFASVFPKLAKLKVLQAMDFIPSTNMLRLLPCLEELYIPCTRRPLSYFENGIRIVASGLPRLKKLSLSYYLHRCLSHILNFDADSFGKENFDFFGEIDVERKKMPDVKKLKVYLEVDHNLDKVKTQYDTIGIERSQTEAITNPFIQTTHLGNTVAAPDNCVIQ